MNKDFLKAVDHTRERTIMPAPKVHKSKKDYDRKAEKRRLQRELRTY